MDSYFARGDPYRMIHFYRFSWIPFFGMEAIDVGWRTELQQFEPHHFGDAAVDMRCGLGPFSYRSTVTTLRDDVGDMADLPVLSCYWPMSG